MWLTSIMTTIIRSYRGIHLRSKLHRLEDFTVCQAYLSLVRAFRPLSAQETAQFPSIPRAHCRVCLEVHPGCLHEVCAVGWPQCPV